LAFARAVAERGYTKFPAGMSIVGTVDCTEYFCRGRIFDIHTRCIKFIKESSNIRPRKSFLQSLAVLTILSLVVILLLVLTFLSFTAQGRCLLEM